MSKAVINPVSYIESIELGIPRKAIERLQSDYNLQIAIESGEEIKAESYLSNKGIVSFASSVSSQNRQDILSSTLLAQLGADKRYPGEENLENWFKAYQDTLQHIGWVVQGKEFAHFSDTQNVFEMQNVIFDILGTALGGNAISIITKTLDAFKKLSDTDNKIIAFEKNTHTLTKGTFLIALCDETNDMVSMKTGAFELTSSNTITKILFFKSSKDKTQLSYSTSDASFNKSAYSVVRKTIEDKLAQVFSSYVAALDI